MREKKPNADEEMPEGAEEEEAREPTTARGAPRTDQHHESERQTPLCSM